ncbi:MAG: carbonic anhydrase [Alphaproteobacteria bacterium]
MPRSYLKKSGKRPLSFAANANKQNFTHEEAAAMAQPHKPEAFLICCIDSRFQPAKALDYGPGVALECRCIACVIPPEKEADADVLSRMAFRRLNNIRNIVLVSHSDCGGAQAALRVPHPDLATGDDLHAIAAIVHRAHPDLARLGQQFLKSEGGDMRKAGDLLAREVGIKSLQNLLGYKGCGEYATVADEVKAGALQVTLLHYDLEKRRFDIYDPGKKKWRHMADAANLMQPAAIPAPQQPCCLHHKAAQLKK